MPGRFLAMVGVVLWRRSDGKYLVLRRSATRDHAAGKWECVTGRLEQGESFEQAVRREAREELGVDVRIECIVGTTHFYRGDKIPENEMVGVSFGCSIEDSRGIRLSDEHSEHRWVTPTEAEAMFSRDHWLTALIARAEQVLKLMPTELRRLHWGGDFEAKPATPTDL